MHPAGSLIYFTVASGFGFGFLFFLGLGIPVVAGQSAFWSYFVGYGLAVTGLLSSVLHLGNKKNAWKALSQWRSSWLSREGVLAVATLLCLAPYAVTQIWDGPNLDFLGYIGSALCLVTVYCTAMIYASLKTVPRWSQPLTPVLFLSYAIMGGAYLAGEQEVMTISMLGTVALQIAHWVVGAGAWRRNPSTMETATGLGGEDGKARLLERPHTGKNYLTSEMVHMVGRKHALRLKVIWGILFAVSVLMGLFGLLPWVELYLIPLALAAIVSRWLFFAEAEHVVGLYYGRSK